MDTSVKACGRTHWCRNKYSGRNPRFSVDHFFCFQFIYSLNSTKLFFRGPNGVWTLERKGEKPTINISFDDAIPTKTHMALKALVESGHVKYIISQNIDGLHLKSGLPRKYISELHGNMFIENCTKCRR